MIDYYETRSQPITRQMVWQAYQKVKSHKGSSGIDTMDWEALARDVRSHLYKLWNRLSSGSYFPQPVKEVAIKKKSRLRGYITNFGREYVGFRVEKRKTSSVN
jgi:RNA-directed DNA polymerase